jgi:hypothetical protein
VSLGIVIIVAGLAGVAIERSIRCGRMRAERDVALVRAQGYRDAAAQIKRDMQRLQSAQDAAIEAAEVAIESGDPRRALSALAGLPAVGRRLSDERTDVMLSEAAATAVANAAGANGVQPRGGLLGRLIGSGDRGVGGRGNDVDP